MVRRVIGVVVGMVCLLTALVGLPLVVGDVQWVRATGTTEDTYLEWICALELVLAAVSGREFSVLNVWFFYVGVPVVLLVLSYFAVFRYGREGSPPRKGPR